MVFNRKYIIMMGLLFLLLGLFAMWLDLPISAVVGETTGTILMVLGVAVMPVDYYPVVTRQVFRDVKTFEEFRDAFIEGVDEDRKRIIWYVYNMSPNDYLNFIRLTAEIREAANDEGMRRLTQHMQRKS